MVDNVHNSESVLNRQVQANQDLHKLVIQKRLNADNPYKELLSVSDTTDISNEALKLFEKEKELQFFKEMATEEPEINRAKVELLKAQYEKGIYKMPSDDELAEALLGNSDFKTLMGF
jgi:anti-sigma28 factor (negative regulator of flagellin synthesis)